LRCAAFRSQPRSNRSATCSRARKPPVDDDGQVRRRVGEGGRRVHNDCRTLQPELCAQKPDELDRRPPPRRFHERPLPHP
jgi:hypothetical protein